MKIYIAGKITGLENYKEKFQKAEEQLTREGHTCMNPAILPGGFPWEAYMPICFKMIDACDGVYMLDNWTDSKGARLELKYAECNNKSIFYEHDRKQEV